MKKLLFLSIVAGLLHVSINFANAILANIERFNNISTPRLITAAQNGALSELENALTDPKVNVNEIDKEGLTALVYASRNGHKKAVMLLLNKGAEPHFEATGTTALREAVKADHKEIIQLLIDKDSINARRSRGYALIEAAKKGDKYMVELLLGKDVDVNVAGAANSEDPYGPECCTTALMQASIYRHKDIVNLLLNKGANPNFNGGSAGMTPLMAAANKGHEDIVKLLLDNGADRNMRNVWHSTALDLAKKNGYKAIVALIEAAMLV